MKLDVITTLDRNNTKENQIYQRTNTPTMQIEEYCKNGRARTS